MAIHKTEEQDIAEALKYIDENGVPSHHESTKYELVTTEGKKYPPKYVIAVADHIANGKDITTSGFTPEEANKCLKNNGFRIEVKQEEQEKETEQIGNGAVGQEKPVQLFKVYSFIRVMIIRILSKDCARR